MANECTDLTLHNSSPKHAQAAMGGLMGKTKAPRRIVVGARGDAEAAEAAVAGGRPTRKSAPARVAPDRVRRLAVPSAGSIFAAADGVLLTTAPAAATRLWDTYGLLPAGIWMSSAQHALFTDVSPAILKGIPFLMTAYFSRLRDRLSATGVAEATIQRHLQTAREEQIGVDTFCTKLPTFSALVNAGIRVARGFSADVEARKILRDSGVLPLGFWVGMITHACRTRIKSEDLQGMYRIKEVYLQILQETAETAIAQKRRGVDGKDPRELLEFVELARSAEHITGVMVDSHRRAQEALRK